MEVVKRRKLMEVNMAFRRQHFGKLDGLSLPPSVIDLFLIAAFATLYDRLTLPESTVNSLF